MDYAKKASKPYKEEQARKVLERGFNGECSKLPVFMKVPRPVGDHVFDGVVGISVVGKQTNIAIPNLELTIDAGANAEKVLERYMVISHFDGDHVEGIGRAICNAINRKSKLVLFSGISNRRTDKCRC